MLYQGFKYFIVRMGVSCLLMLTLGYGVLFFVHEVAMPVSRVDDSILQWVLLAVCSFFGFVVFGMFGEYRFARGLRLLRESELKEQTVTLFRQFQELIRFTYSSYFRPQVGKRLRHRVFHEYAEHLLNLGVEDSEAQSIYARAYLLDPGNQKFKDILVSILTRKEKLTNQEIDLLLIILKANNYEDRGLVNFLVDWFLERDLFTVKTEPVFHKALELKTGKEHRITRFLVPVLLAEKRVDPNSAEFFLFALPEAGPDQRKKLVRVLGLFFCEKRFQVIRPDLHEQCRKVFESLDSQTQVQLAEEADKKNLGGKWKRIRLFTSEDRDALKDMLARAGLTRSLGSRLGQAMMSGLRFIGRIFRSILGMGLSCLEWFGQQNLRLKLIASSGMFLILLVTISLWDWSPDEIEPSQETPPPAQTLDRPIPDKSRLYTIQIAAVTSQAKADKVMSALNRNKVNGVYLRKQERKSGGVWYKIRVGKFESKEEAEEFAERLAQRKLVRNYFFISYPRPGSESTSGGSTLE